MGFKGVEEYYSTKWYQKAADKGHAPAQNNLGWMYHNGCGVPKNDEEAIKWYQKAAGQGLVYAKETVQQLMEPLGK
ncbi:tetratricopeptide repeat protein [Candidatus Amoebophilus asiaticus]|uniref:tetratricopeptide repeat protein n=1 Tax=Candidatus Amoebophilus asiaticus TaxID=281120 RepID=UPI0011D1381B|nr:tetratricopeptide repeat protein [Candidatus Amoebophilus asiaticus]